VHYSFIQIIDFLVMFFSNGFSRLPNLFYFARQFPFRNCVLRSAFRAAKSKIRKPRNSADGAIVARYTPATRKKESSLSNNTEIVQNNVYRFVTCELSKCDCGALQLIQFIFKHKWMMGYFECVVKQWCTASGNLNLVVTRKLYITRRKTFNRIS